ncbi:MAG: T9SS type A sorting domain-containing protein, partial [Rhodothermaceae bacterium]|nr:T9SS type A sorting domain-containing protein [Rhodothermaceae bacterium]
AETAQFNGPNGIVATASGDTLYVSEFNSQAVRRIVRVRETANEPGAVPVATSRLLPVAPNPFIYATTIRMQLDEPQHVALTVYDALGRRVAVLADGARPAGTHSVPFDAGALAAGTYLVRLQTASGSDRMPLTLTR